MSEWWISSPPAVGSGRIRSISLPFCDVIWARTADAGEDHGDLLDATERERVSSLRDAADRDRYELACVVLRSVAGARLGIAPRDVAIDRTFGRPVVAGLSHVSVAHAGDVVGVAVASDPVGLDVEPMTGSRPAAGSAQGAAMGAPEVAVLPQKDRAAALLRLWTRKEAVLRATGDGLRIEPSHVVVSGALEPPRLVSFAGRPHLEARAHLVDLFPVPGYVGALCLLTATPPRIHPHFWGRV